MFPWEKHTQFAEKNIYESASKKAYKTQWIASYEEFRGYFPPSLQRRKEKKHAKVTLVWTGSKCN